MYIYARKKLKKSLDKLTIVWYNGIVEEYVFCGPGSSLAI